MTPDQQKQFWRVFRNVFLVLMLVSEGGMLLLMGLGHHWEWFWPFVGINFCIFIGEGLSYWAVHKTMSTRYGDWIHKAPVPALGALGLFFFSMFCLCAHLIGYGAAPKDEAPAA